MLDVGVESELGTNKSWYPSRRKALQGDVFTSPPKMTRLGIAGDSWATVSDLSGVKLYYQSSCLVACVNLKVVFSTVKPS